MARIHNLLLLAALPALFAACGRAPAAENAGAPVRVETQAVRLVDYRDTIFAAGRLSAKEEIKLSFKTGGIIKGIYVRQGQTVREGQLLAELDLVEIGAQTEQARLGRHQAQIGIENAKLALRLAERDYQNALGLYRDSVATLEQLQNAEIQLSNARNQLEAARANLNISERQITVADVNYRYSRIFAPTDGVILLRLAETNELAGPGLPVLLFGAKNKLQVIKVNIVDRDIVHIAAGDSAEVRFDAFPAQLFQGVVREIAGTADPFTGTYEVEIEVLPTRHSLLSGFIGSVRLRSGEVARLFAVPVDALAGAGAVFALREGRAVKIPVDIARIRGRRLLVSGDLQDGEPIIISNVGYLEDGQPVVAAPFSLSK
jgi:RND family efflux transporter MFP subunit